MHTTLAHQVDWQTWRTAAKTLALANTPPDETTWSVGTPDDLFAETPPPATSDAKAFTLPRALVALLETIIQHSDPERFALMYRLLWRAHAGERHLLEMTTDPEIHRANRLAQNVRRDTHKMRAFVRFREVPEPEGLKHVAWFEPDHYIVEANAPFFVRRFATMRWSILTPYRSVHWDGTDLAFAPGAIKADIPDDDHLEAYWRTYFSSIFNPARLKIGAMTSEMPRKYWRNLPEAAAIPDLIRTATARTTAMIEQPAISPAKPPRPSAAPRAEPAASPLAAAAAAIHDCRRCNLWQPATQPVFGEGPVNARIMFIGEQPGDQEDLGGRPFIGPAGQLFDRAMAEAGLDRATVYVTNAVKHFKFVPRGKRRIHDKPGISEITACKFWLDLERAEIAPALTVMLGATAARAVLGRAVTITRERSRPLPLDANRTGFITVHPSYLLRLPDEDAKAREYQAFVNDLRTVKELAA
jgi:DNA polymerase